MSRRRVFVVITVALTAVVLCASVASAHVEVTPDQAAKSSSSLFSFAVPNEQDAANTVKVEVTFPTLQTYSNGDVVRWIQETVKGAPEPEFPVPMLQLTKAKRGH